MNTELEDKLHKLFSDCEYIVSAPGRINLIGEHIDYNDGFVLPAAIDRAIYLGFQKKETGTSTTIESKDFDEKIEIGHNSSKSSWTKYFVAIHDLIEENKWSHHPISCKVFSDLPIGAGISSSAALCCGYLFGMNEINDWKLSRLEIAKMAQQVEHRIGIKCGLMDQYAVMHGMNDKAILLDCKSETHQYVDLRLRNHELYLINSNIKHELVGSPYNNRRKACEKVLDKVMDKFYDVNSWQDISHHMIDEVKSNLSISEYNQGIFVVEEFQRVKYVAAKLTELNVEAIGAALYETHEGLSEQYKVSCDETDLLVTLAKENGVTGARMMGGGFGGCTINLLKKNEAQNKIEAILSEYQNKTGISPTLIPVNIGNGVNLIQL